MIERRWEREIENEGTDGIAIYLGRIDFGRQRSLVSYYLRLFMSVCPSVQPSVCLPACLSVHLTLCVRLVFMLYGQCCP